MLRLVNVGNSAVKLNLVPVDFVVKGIAALATDENAVGKTIALADPNPLTTEQLFDEIAKALTNKTSVIKPPAQLVEKIIDAAVFARHFRFAVSVRAVFFRAANLRYERRRTNCFPRTISLCPAFPSYVGNLLKFVEEHPKL